MKLLPVFVFSAMMALAQSGTPKFAIADLHRTENPDAQQPSRPPVVNGARYEIRNATLIDLIHLAWDHDADWILGGPAWVEQERFDVIAKVPSGSTPESHRMALRALLAERLNLMLHSDTRTVNALVLTATNKPRLRRATGSGEEGCTMQGMSDRPEWAITYACRNMTMPAFAAALTGMMGAHAPRAPLDKTGLSGKWNFEVKWAVPVVGLPLDADASKREPYHRAIEKQLGLKLEQGPVMGPVLIIDNATASPAPNPPGVASALASPTMPTEFEVADVKPSKPGERSAPFQRLPGGRYVVKGQTMGALLYRALSSGNRTFVGAPPWTESERFDINARATLPAGAPPLDGQNVGPLLQALLVERFHLKHHVERRQVNVHALVAVKPKLKKADPTARSFCRQQRSALGGLSSDITLTCQNATMDMVAAAIGAPGVMGPVQNATGLSGRWDLSVSYTTLPDFVREQARRAQQENSDLPSAPGIDESLTVFQAIQKHLGLKLEPRKRMAEVVVIDSLDRRPTAN